MSLTGWWLMQDTNNGYIGLAKLSSSSATVNPVVPADVRAKFNGGASDFFQFTYLGTNINGPKVGSILSNTSRFWGASTEQWQALVDSIDSGAIFKGATSVAAGPAVGPGASSTASGQASGLTSSGSEAVSAGINPPGGIDLSGIGNALGTIASAFAWLGTPAHWLTVLKVIAGAVAVYFAIRSLTGVGPSASDLAQAAKVIR